MDISRTNRLDLLIRSEQLHKPYRFWTPSSGFKSGNAWVRYLMSDLVVRPVQTPIKPSYDRWVQRDCLLHYTSLIHLPGQVRDDPINRSMWMVAEWKLGRSWNSEEHFQIDIIRFCHCWIRHERLPIHLISHVFHTSFAHVSCGLPFSPLQSLKHSNCPRFFHSSSYITCSLQFQYISTTLCIIHRGKTHTHLFRFLSLLVISSIQRSISSEFIGLRVLFWNFRIHMLLFAIYV